MIGRIRRSFCRFVLRANNFKSFRRLKLTTIHRTDRRYRKKPVQEDQEEIVEENIVEDAWRK